VLAEPRKRKARARKPSSHPLVDRKKEEVTITEEKTTENRAL
jgi:hypothetical protein